VQNAKNKLKDKIVRSKRASLRLTLTRGLRDVAAEPLRCFLGQLNNYLITSDGNVHFNLLPDAGTRHTRRPDPATERTNVKNFLKLLLGSGLFLLEQSDRTTDVRERAAHKIDNLRDAVQQKYEDAADRVAKASRAIRGEDNHVLGNALRFAAGIGVGIGVGLLLAPASGQDTRGAIAGGVQQFGNKVRKQIFSERDRATPAVG
jgi:ElaB/YqjD/DUF883 family membrane-anchored ribosome-binding protein